MTQIEFVLKRYLMHLNRMARASGLALDDCTWLDGHRQQHKLSESLGYPQLISELQDIYGLQLVAARLTS